MENLIFSLNATMPVFLMMVLGYVLNKIGVFDESFADKMNRFVFNAALQVLLFKDMSSSDFYLSWDGSFVLFCFLTTLICIFAMAGLSCFLKDKTIQGEFIQASFRSSPALLGVAFVQNIYGKAGAASLMIIGAVPLYNVASVVVLTLMRPERGTLDKALLLKTGKGIVTNPLIIGVLAGIVWSLLRITQPVIMEKTISGFAATATPLGLMALGASFDVKKAFSKLRPAMVCTMFKLVVFAAVFLPAAIRMGFRQDKLVSILVMLGAAATVSCFTMARSMGHEGILSSSVVMLTTIFSAFTLTGWLYAVKCLGLI